jgi:hypothetical protein
MEKYKSHKKSYKSRSYQSIKIPKYTSKKKLISAGIGLSLLKEKVLGKRAREDIYDKVIDLGHNALECGYFGITYLTTLKFQKSEHTRTATVAALASLGLVALSKGLEYKLNGK